jgi:ribosomal protein S12 methylthiotransferase
MTDPDPSVALLTLGCARNEVDSEELAARLAAGGFRLVADAEDDLQILCDFLEAARMDVTGVFGYSDEDGTEAASYDDKLDADEIAARTRHVTDLVEELNAQRAEERIGEEVEVLVESLEDGEVTGRAAHQGPEVDGSTYLVGSAAAVGDLVRAHVIETDGVDLVAKEIG